MRIFTGIDDLQAAVGDHLGYTSWREVTQREIDLFAEATGDDQWIHVDVSRAQSGPFGATIAHGYFTLSVLPTMIAELTRIEGFSFSLNYGLDRVRFLAPVLVGSRIRVGAELLDVTEGERGIRTRSRYTVEVEGEDRPVCVADGIGLLIP